MSEMAKSARSAMHDKVKRLTTADPHQKVDASSWTPPEAENANIQTGERPISKRQFKRGGKVEGEFSQIRADRKMRKAGGMTANEYLNRNVKDANEERDGPKHVGGFKRGGTANYESTDFGRNKAKADVANAKSRISNVTMRAQQVGGMDEPRYKNRIASAEKDHAAAKSSAAAYGFKRGGAPSSAEWGHKEAKERVLDQNHLGAGMANDHRGNPVTAPRVLDQNKLGVGMSKTWDGKPRKSGGKVHSDAKEDRALVREMVEKKAIKPKERASGGKLDGELQGTRPEGGRLARKSGGRSGKGKMNVNIVIAAGGQKPDEQAMPPQMAPHPPMPMPTPPPQMAGPPPMAPGAGGPPPVMRKQGGRTMKIAEEMARAGGAGGGEGRLEKAKAYGLK